MKIKTHIFGQALGEPSSRKMGRSLENLGEELGEPSNRKMERSSENLVAGRWRGARRTW